MWKFSARRTCLLALMVVSPTPAWAMCCPGDATIIKAAESGLGQSQPSTSDLSLDPRWRVHAFERDGISYYQVGDVMGVLQFIVARSGQTFWLLPAGYTDAQIILPSDDRSTNPAANAEEVYRHPEFALVVSGIGTASSWWVELRPTSSPKPSTP